MENLRCAEFLSESPSTSSAPARLGRAASSSFSSSLTTLSAPSTRHQQSALHLQQSHFRRRGTKSDIGLRQSSYSESKLLLGQIPVSRKRQSTTERLNTAQWPSVLPLADKTVHCDDRCLDSMFKAQSANNLHVNCFVSIQVDVTAHHRQQAVEWIYDVCKEEHCEPDVFLLAVSLVDRFLSVQCIFRNNLQALAGACLFVSSKVKAPQPLNAERIAYYTDGAVRMDQILQGELLVLSKLNWDVSTSTALDFLDQVAARYSDLHSLSEGCRFAVHRIQLDEKFAFLVPSVQAALCLMFAAVCSDSAEIIQCAEDALINVLRCNPQILYNYISAVQNLVTGSSELYEKRDLSPSKLITPAASGSPHTPVLTSPSSETATVIITPQTGFSQACSRGISPEASQAISDDSGFISGFSSPSAAILSVRKFGGNNMESKQGSSASRRRLRRSTNANHQCSRKSYEIMDNGVIAYYHANEDDFLSSY